MSEAVGREAVDDPERIAELIVEAWPDDARRQSVTHVADAFANMVPGVRNFPGARAVFEIDEDGGHAGACETAQEIEVWRFLQRAFKPLRDLFEHVVDAGARPCGLNHHGLYDE